MVLTMVCAGFPIGAKSKEGLGQLTASWYGKSQLNPELIAMSHTCVFDGGST